MCFVSVFDRVDSYCRLIYVKKNLENSAATSFLQTLTTPLLKKKKKTVKIRKTFN